MLIFARRTNEQFILPTLGVTVTVVEIKTNGTVRLGIEAPLEVPVHRREVWEAIQRGNDGNGTNNGGSDDNV